MQFQVPQFIETEDKIVGPLSLRQFMIVGAGVGIAALVYFIVQLWLWVILAIFFIGGAAAIAFLKIQGRPFWNVLLSAFHFYWNPQVYVWKAEQPRMPAPAAVSKIETPPTAAVVPLRKKAAGGTALHSHWEHLQTGQKMSSRQFTEHKMFERYQIFQKLAGDREAARRVDYR